MYGPQDDRKTGERPGRSGYVQLPTIKNAGGRESLCGSF